VALPVAIALGRLDDFVNCDQFCSADTLSFPSVTQKINPFFMVTHFFVWTITKKSLEPKALRITSSFASSFSGSLGVSAHRCCEKFQASLLSHRSS